jgi:hypothetical protein
MRQYKDLNDSEQEWALLTEIQTIISKLVSKSAADKVGLPTKLVTDFSFYAKFADGLMHNVFKLDEHCDSLVLQLSNLALYNVNRPNTTFPDYENFHTRPQHLTRKQKKALKKKQRKQQRQLLTINASSSTA